MTALFEYKMALAAADPNPFNLFPDGENHWMVMFFDKRGCHTGSIFGLRKSVAMSRAAKYRKEQRKIK